MEKLFSHLSVFVIEENRQFCIKYGLHLNGLGKKIASIGLALTLHILLLKESKQSEIGYYEDLVQETSHTSNANHSSSKRPDESIKTKHIRNKPVTKMNYFYVKVKLN
jgi:hypothetical protein